MNNFWERTRQHWTDSLAQLQNDRWWNDPCNSVARRLAVDRLRWLADYAVRDRAGSALQKEAETLAQKRQRIHDGFGNNTERFFSDRAMENRIGLFGELQFEKEFGFKADRGVKAWGDKGVDFRTPLGIVDVKTAQKPVYLFVKTNQIGRADIYVLAQYNSNRSATLIGWATKDEMRKCPQRDFGYGITNFYKAAGQLHPIEELKERYAMNPQPFAQKKQVEEKAKGQMKLYS